MIEVGRNSLCPCGSGMKYKKCCMLVERSDGSGGPTGREVSGKTLGILIGVGAVVGVIVGQAYDAQTGIAIGGAIAAGAVAWSIFRDPPAPKSGGDDPAAINFGTSR
ncbi:MAG TPA: hypothetical protein DCQ06_04875 [Myxococcales bacterium]|nr:hypothetical protein [Myxococcales bacterium]